MSVPAFFNRVMETSAAFGTGSYTLDGPELGFQAMSVVGDGALVPYCAVSVDVGGVPDGDWEVGIGTYTLAGTVLARTVIQENSNGDTNPIDWPSGTLLQIFLTVPAAYAPGLVKIAEANPTGTGTVTFSSLGLFTHLKIFYSARGTQVATSSLLNVNFNGDSGANYDRQHLNAAGASSSAAESLAQTSAAVGVVSAASASAGQVGVGEITIFDYRGSTFQKQGVSTLNYKTSTASGGFNLRTMAFAWRNTAPITSVALSLSSGNFDTGSKLIACGMF